MVDYVGRWEMKVLLSNQYNTNLKEVKTEGWSWGALFLGFLWYWIYGMWGKGILYLVVGLILLFTIVGPIALWLYMAINFNKEYYEFLLDSGYKEHDSNTSKPEVKETAASYIKELEKLALLRDKGTISEEEFETKKKQILNI